MKSTPKKATVASKDIEAKSHGNPNISTIAPPIITPVAVAILAISFQSEYSRMCLPLSRCSAKMASKAGLPSASPTPKSTCKNIKKAKLPTKMKRSQPIALTRNPPNNRYSFSVTRSPTLEMRKVKNDAEIRNAAQVALMSNTSASNF